MIPVYRQEYTLTDNLTDPFGRAKPSALLSFVQDAAGKHCVLLGAGWNALQEKNLFWAVTRHRVDISRLPLLGETITVETWPMPTSRVAYPRAVVAYDREGNTLLRVISLWVLMDTDNRSMVLPAKSGVPVEGILRGCEPDIPRALPFRETENRELRRVVYSELDRNHHMNNTRYLDWALDLLPGSYHEAHPVREITVCYLSEATESQPVQLDWSLSEDGILFVNGLREEISASEQQGRIFAVRMCFD